MPQTIERVPQQQYRAAPGAGFDDKAAARYGKFLERKAGLGKRLASTQRIVELAKPKSSPIHEVIYKETEQEAARERRLFLARHLVDHIVEVTGFDEEGEEIISRAFHNVTVRNGETERGYISARVVWAKPELAEQVIAKALRELENWRDRYQSYSELAIAVAKVDELLDEAA